jgi:hypothetical protein
MPGYRRRVLTIVVACASLLGALTTSVSRAAADTPTPTWTQQFPWTTPTARGDASIAYDPATGQLVLFGGNENGSWFSDTWTWDGSDWTKLSPATSPPACQSCSMAYDPATGQLVLFSSGSGGAETWTWDGSDWTEQSPSTSPLARAYASMAYDPGTGQLVLFGGENSGDDLSDTWTWDGADWTEQSPSMSPQARQGASMAYDPGTGQLVLFGGDVGADDAYTWIWNGSTWIALLPSTSPSARYLASMAYDAGTGQLVLFGGENAGNHGDTWTWDGSDWTEEFPSTSPLARSCAAMAYDAGTGQLVLFGGCGFGDTWTWGYPSSAVSDWTDQSPSTSPTARADASMAYDPGTGQLVLFGGNGGSGVLADTWTWNGSDWAEQSPATSPPARSDASMAYDPGTGQLVLFGGNDGSGVLADTWTWNGSDWAEQSPATSAASRSDASMAYDPGTGQLVLFGGNDGEGGIEGDTWSFSLVKASQSITFSSSTPSSVMYSRSNNQTYVVSASASSGLSVTLSIDPTSTSGCTISGSTVSYGGGTGTCIIEANQSGSGGYLVAPELQQSFTIAQASQAITFSSTAPSSATVSGTTYTPTASSSSGLTVQFSIDGASSTGSCTILAGVVSFTGVGTCIVDANQPEDANYLAATEVQQSFTIGQGSQTISFTSSSPLSVTYSGSNNQTYMVSATASSGLSVALSIDPSSTSGCTISGLTVSYGGGVGTCIVDANQPEDANYLAATEVQQSFTIGQGSQTITFSTTAPSSVTYSGSNDQIYLVSTTDSSGLLVSSSIDPTSTSGCTISGLTVSFGGGVGTCVIDANQAGNTDYLAAIQAQQSFTIVGPTPPPGYVGVSIDSGDYATDSYSVQLDLVWPDGATSALVSNDGGFDAVGGTETIPLSAEVSWTLENTGFNGLPETVYVRFLGVGIDTTTFTDDIILDETIPSISSATFVGASGSVTPSAVTTKSRGSAISSLHSYSVKIQASEQFSGVSTVALSSSKSGGTTVTFTSPKHKGLLTLESTVTVSMTTVPRYVRVRSAAGKWSRWLAIATIPRLAIDSNNVVPAKSKVPVKLTCESGSCSGTVELTGSVTDKVAEGTKTITKTEIVVLAYSTYTLAAERSATIALVLTTTGRKILAHVGTKSVRETISVTTRGGSTMRKLVLVS